MILKQVVEEQIRLEKTREAELDMLYQDEAAKVWHQREAEWNNERAARERLMNEVKITLFVKIFVLGGVMRYTPQQGLMHDWPSYAIRGLDCM